MRVIAPAAPRPLLMVSMMVAYELP